MSQKLGFYSLSEFIKETLVEINKGVRDAKSAGVPIAYERYETGEHPRVQTVNFDIGVILDRETDSGKAMEGKLGISVFSANFGKKLNKVESSKDTHRVQFSVDAFIGKEIE